MYTITLRGPETTTVMSSDDISVFNRFISWLKEYNPARIADLSVYPIKTDARMAACRIKARKLGLLVE